MADANGFIFHEVENNQFKSSITLRKSQNRELAINLISVKWKQIKLLPIGYQIKNPC
jgi:hypothetical protein